MIRISQLHIFLARFCELTSATSQNRSGGLGIALPFTFLATLIVVLSCTSNCMGGPVLYFSGPTPMSAAAVQHLKDGEAMAKTIQSALNSGNYAAAEKYAKESIYKYKYLISAEGYLASALAAQGKDSAAMQEYEVMLKHRYSSPEVFLSYALLLAKHDQMAKAISMYNEALPQSGDTFLHGLELLKEDDDFTTDAPDKAKLEADIHIALGFDESNDYGVVVSSKNIERNAYEECRAALKLQPDSPLVNLVYAMGLGGVGKWDESHAALDDVARRFNGRVKEVALDELRRFPKSSVMK